MPVKLFLDEKVEMETCMLSVYMHVHVKSNVKGNVHLLTDAYTFIYKCTYIQVCMYVVINIICFSMTLDQLFNF